MTVEPQLALPAVASEQVGPGEVWRVLGRNRWLILVCSLLGLAVGIFLARRVEPVYEASAKILVEARRIPVTAVETPGSVPDENRIGTEIEVLQSSALVEQVVDSLQLQLEVTEPRSLRRSELFSRIEVSPRAAAAGYRFVQGAGGRFKVVELTSGMAMGTAAPGEPIRLRAATLVLAPGAARHESFEVAIDTREGAVLRVGDAIEVVQPAREADVIRVSYRGTDPEVVRDIPNVLTARFVALRKDLRTMEARKTAEFLRRQLDTLRLQLTEAEDRLQSFREQEQVVDLPVEASTQVTRYAQMEAERGALNAERTALGAMIAEARRASREPGKPSPYRRLVAFPTLLRNDAATGILTSLAKVEDERAELLTRRRPNDPDVQALTRRVNELEDQLGAIVTTYQQGLSSQVASIDATLGGFARRLDRIPGKELEFARLSRQTKVLEDMYGLLQTRLKEAEIAQAVQDPSVRLVDAARLPASPAGSRRNLLVGFSTIFGVLLGVALGFVREYRDSAVHTREDLQAATGLPVLGWIPRLSEMDASGKRVGSARRAARKLLSPSRPVRGSAARALLPRGAEGRVSVGSFGRDDAPSRASHAYEWLHRNLQFARPDAEVKSLLFTSPLPGDGKTTTAAGLAVTLARRGFKVLLIDADLRRGSLSTLLPGPRDTGLSDLLVGTAPFNQVVRTLEVGGGNVLHYLPTGVLPPDPTRLLGSARGAALFEWLKEKYYLVILDCPPINVFADPAILAEYADGVVLVARAGTTPFEALVYSAEQCRSANLPVLGTVLNEIDPSRDRDYDGAYRWYEYARSYYPQAVYR
ncbi:MAG TPA: polysaccharide biosynthesis tyrosine autokinase [Longimicrobiaceae bacterium]|nr:polysaccharide biosynthesis tyrosine autokinase [Longimicrobiaceae bacterium]